MSKTQTLTMMKTPRRISLGEIEDVCKDIPFVKSTKKVEYANAVFTFDIETSSFYEDGEKRNCMYCFVFYIRDFNHYMLGRTWEEFTAILDKLYEVLDLNPQRRIVVYVHNLAYEFQYLSKRLSWGKIFALDKREPVQCFADDYFVEFRCSYKLSGYSLETLGKNLHKYPCLKLKGDLDYSKIRTSETPLTDTEWGYVINDGRVVSCYIQELIDEWGNITRLPMTKTGFVRNYCRKNCLPKGKAKSRENYRYRKLMKLLSIKSVPEYMQLKRALQGGFTHGNALYTGVVVENVTSLDYTSDYPAHMVCEQYPMSEGRLVVPKSKKEFERYLEVYCCLFDITLYDVDSTTYIDHPISLSKCIEIDTYQNDNGRIVSAKKLTTTITEQDYIVYRKYYHWSKMIIRNMRVYAKNYLPKAFVESILKLYGDKTKLKGVEGKEKEYMNSKEQVNSCFGMCVTDICRDDIEFNDEGWSSVPCDVQKALEHNNRSEKRFLFYAWGVWVTAHCRRELLLSMLQVNNPDNGYSDYLYSDTDSMKIRNYEKHKDFVDKFNAYMDAKMKKAMDYHHLDFALTRPKTIDGVEKPLGWFDMDAQYKRFKYLGAKRYFYETIDGKINMVVSGLNKKIAVPYLIKKAEEKNVDVFTLFDAEMYIPSYATGKNTHTYIDYETEGDVVDYLGHVGHYHELSSVHMEGADYSLSMTDTYINYILGLKEVRCYED